MTSKHTLGCGVNTIDSIDCKLIICKLGAVIIFPCQSINHYIKKAVSPLHTVK